MNPHRITPVLLTCLAIGLSILTGGSGRGIPVLAQTEAPATPTPDRLAPPPMPANPTQADYGAQMYYFSCMACHGDRGQGLTREWREAWDPADQDCWQSKCHAANHPPEGYELPRYVPAVVGSGTLAHFATAQALFAYVSTRMPYQAPGALSLEDYWAVVAFLLEANGVPLQGRPLDAATASAMRLRPASRSTGRDASGAGCLLMAGAAVLVGLGVLAGLADRLKF